MHELTLACIGQHRCGVTLFERAVANLGSILRDFSTHKLTLACVGRCRHASSLLECAEAADGRTSSDGSVRELTLAYEAAAAAAACHGSQRILESIDG